MDEIEREERVSVVAEAKTWKGTPYVHCGDIKRGGVDCGMLLVRVYADTAMIEPFDPRPYSRTWMLHRDEERYLNLVTARAREIEIPQPGDIALWHVGRLWAHGGIVTEWPYIVHAYADVGKVIESDVSRPGIFTQDDRGNKRTPRFFSVWPRDRK